MIREKRNKEKLASYYRKFMEDGVIDPNVHPLSLIHISAPTRH